MKIAILGGGHGCYAAAADLSLSGITRIVQRMLRSTLLASSPGCC